MLKLTFPDFPDLAAVVVTSALDGTPQHEAKCPRCRHGAYVHTINPTAETAAEIAVPLGRPLVAGETFNFACPHASQTECHFIGTAVVTED